MTDLAAKSQCLAGNCKTTQAAGSCWCCREQLENAAVGSAAGAATERCREQLEEQQGLAAGAFSAVRAAISANAVLKAAGVAAAADIAAAAAGVCRHRMRALPT